MNMTDPAVISGAVTVSGFIINGFFSHLRDRGRERRAALRAGVIVTKIEENTEENRTQIHTSNGVNEKIAATVKTAAAANTVAVTAVTAAAQANTVAVDGLAHLRSEVGDLKTEFGIMRSEVRCLVENLRRASEQDTRLVQPS